MEEEKKTEEVSYSDIDKFFLIKIERIGNLYFNAIHIQDMIELELKSIPLKEQQEQKSRFLLYKYNISYLSEDCEVISSDVDILKTEISGKSSRDIEIFNLNETNEEKNYSLKGKLKNMINHNDNTFIELSGKTEKLIKIKSFLMKQQKSKKSIEFLANFNKRLFVLNESTKTVKININYKIYFKSYLFKSLPNSDQNWFFQHFLTFKNDKKETSLEPIILTNEELDTFFIETHVYFKSFILGEDEMMFKRIYFQNHSIPESISFSNYEKVDYSPSQEVQESNPPSYLSKRSSNDYKVVSDSVESISGQILLSSDTENSYLLYRKKRINAKIFNLFTFDHYSDYELSNIDFKDFQYDKNNHPDIKLVFVNNYLSKTNEIKSNSLPTILPGKLKIFNGNEEILSKGTNQELKLDSSTESIDLGQASNILISSKLIKKESSINSLKKIFLLKITNLSLSKTIITLKFDYIEQVTILFHKSSNENTSNQNQIMKDVKFILENPSKDKNNIKFNGNFENNFSLFLDFFLEEKSIDYIIFSVKPKK